MKLIQVYFGPDSSLKKEEIIDILQTDLELDDEKYSIVHEFLQNDADNNSDNELPQEYLEYVNILFEKKNESSKIVLYHVLIYFRRINKL